MNPKIPKKCWKVLWDKSGKRYKVLYGGRGSGKSWSTARYLLLTASQTKTRILCTREIQNSIKDSVYRLLIDQITELGLQGYFIQRADTILGVNGSEFIFKGLQKNINEIKSTEGIDICWIEEAERVSENSWDNLVPTVRKEGSFFIIIFNPEDEKSATFTRFIERDGIKVNNPDLIKEFVNYWNNPFFPEVLRKEMEWDRKNDPDKFEHVWRGNPKKYGDAVIFKNKIIIEDFETPDGEQLYFGADFGYAQDPSTLVRMHIREKKLWIDYEAYGVGVEIDELHGFFGTVPGSHQWEITADSARPETISHLSRPTRDGQHDSFQIKGAEKGKGSVEDGIMFLKSFEAIVIHPRCKGAIDNFGNYRWKTDKITGAILPIPLDKSNHVCLCGDTKIRMGDGTTKNIRDVKLGEKVMTSKGKQKVLDSCLTSNSAKVKIYKFSNGSHIIATPSHRIYSTKGLKTLDTIRYQDIIMTWKTSSLMDRIIDGMDYIMSRLVVAIKGASGYMWQYGKAKMEMFQEDITSTTKTLIRPTTISTISNVLRLKSINAFIQSTIGLFLNMRKECYGYLKRFDLLRLNGIGQKRVMRGIRSTERRPLGTEKQKIMYVSAAGKNSGQEARSQDFAQMPVNQNGGEITGKTMLGRIVSFAVNYLHQISFQKYQPVHLVAVEDLSQNISVYNLTVDNAHNYYANGILVSNCDACRYGLESWIKSELSLADVL